MAIEKVKCVLLSFVIGSTSMSVKSYASEDDVKEVKEEVDEDVKVEVDNSKESSKPQEAPLWLTMTAPVIVGVGIASFGIGLIVGMSANMSDKRNVYDERCHGNRDCEDEHYMSDMKLARVFTAGGILVTTAGLGLLAYKGSAYSRVELVTAPNSFVAFGAGKSSLGLKFVYNW